MNIAVAEPSRFRVLRHYISSKEHGAFVLASLTGIVTGFSNDVDKPCYINVKPFFHSWPRFAAVLKGVCEADSLFFHTSQGGIVFGTCCPDVQRPRVFHQEGKNCAPIKSGMLRSRERSKFRCLVNDTRLRNFTVPIFDGRSGLNLSEYWNDQYVGDVWPGAAVMTLFSIRKGALPEDARNFEMSRTMTAICLHVLGVIVLAEPSDPFDFDQSPDLGGVRGVHALPRLVDEQLELREESESTL